MKEPFAAAFGKNWKWWICLVTFLYVTSKWFIMFLFHVSKHNSTIIFIAEISGFGRLACFVAVFSLLDVWFRRPKPSRKLESLLWYHRGCEKSGWIPPCQIPGINKLILGKIPNYKLLRGRSCHACLLMRLCDTVCVCVCIWHCSRKPGSNAANKRVVQLIFLPLKSNFDLKVRQPGWWFQPIWKISYSQIWNLPQIRVKIKDIWNHHLATTPSSFQHLGIPSFGFHQGSHENPDQVTKKMLVPPAPQQQKKARMN